MNECGQVSTRTFLYHERMNSMGMMLGPDKGAYLCKAIQEGNKILGFPPSSAAPGSGIVGGSLCKCVLAILGELAVDERVDYRSTNLGAILDTRETSL
jgi:hypothetical protein